MASTRFAAPAMAAASEAAGLPPAKCEVYKIHLGGGFGRRGAVHDWVRQAVEIAKQMPGTPVKLLWSREEDMLHGRYHPITKCKLTGALAGAITDSAVKERVLREEAEDIGPEATSLATGDGANDIPMLAAATWGIAFRAKPRARAAADGTIDRGDLTAVLELFGIPREEWVA